MNKNNRQIEFRFWGVAQKPPCFIDLKKWVVYGTAAESFEDMFNNPLLVPQEYTGLLDKNGKKIFEGDIVECWFNMRSEVKNIGFIKFSQKYGNLGVKIEKTLLSINALEVPKPFSNFITNDSKLLIKVIGNIFETPNLIE